MNNVRGQLANMLRVVPSEAGFSAFLCVGDELAILPDHFPGAAVVPGMCLVQAVLLASESAVGKPLRLRKLTNAKFMAPALPAMAITIDGSLNRSGEGSVQVKASLQSEGKRLAQIVLVAEPAGELP